MGSYIFCMHRNLLLSRSCNSYYNIHYLNPWFIFCTLTFSLSYLDIYEYFFERGISKREVYILRECVLLFALQVLVLLHLGAQITLCDLFV